MKQQESFRTFRRTWHVLQSGLANPGRTATKCSREAMTSGIASAHYSSLPFYACQETGSLFRSAGDGSRALET